LATHKLLVVVGTRPEAIKLAPVIRRFREDPCFSVEICATGQHRELLAQALDHFALSPDHDLAVMMENQSLGSLTARTMEGMACLLRKTAPRVVMVQGDTTSAMTAALAAFYERIPVAHVEAGLRTNDKYSPFPEEINRRLIAGIAHWNFAPTIGARDNLLREGISADSIHVTGNTAIDALLWTVDKMGDQEVELPAIVGDALDTRALNGRRVVLVTAHRRENHERGIGDICDALLSIAALPGATIVFPVHFNPNVRQIVLARLGGKKNIHLLDPVDYRSFTRLLSRSFLVLTDSGGVQEEAPSLGKPVLVMRDTTERPEGIVAGNAILVGTRTLEVYEAVETLWNDETARSRMARVANPYGDGKAAERIFTVIRGLNGADYERNSLHPGDADGREILG
jgi:UDP-N-acetylglucosamine 2-epimerase (non-hydrolysing)